MEFFEHRTLHIRRIHQLRVPATSSLARASPKRADTLMQIRPLHAQRHAPRIDTFQPRFLQRPTALCSSSADSALPARSTAPHYPRYAASSSTESPPPSARRRTTGIAIHTRIAQLPRVAGPLAGFERIPDFGMETLLAETVAHTEIVEEVLSHRRISCGRSRSAGTEDRHHADAVVKAIASLPCATIACRSRFVAEATRTVTQITCSPPTRWNSPSCSTTQQFSLRIRMQIADLIQEQRPVVGQFENLPRRIDVAPG